MIFEIILEYSDSKRIFSELSPNKSLLPGMCTISWKYDFFSYLRRHKAAIGLNYFACYIFLNTLLVNILFSLQNCPLKVFICFISDIVMFKSHLRRVPTCFYSLLSKCNGAAAVSMLWLFLSSCMKRRRIQPLSMKAQAPLHSA